MSQRRAAAKASSTDGTKATVVEVNNSKDGIGALPLPPVAKEVRIPLSLDSTSSPDHHHDEADGEIVPLTEYDPERQKIERFNACVKNWKESAFACGLTAPTWRDEQTRPSPHENRALPPDETGCLKCSAYICAWMGASRVGNMAVLKQSQEWVEEITVDEETGQTVTRRYTRPRLDVVVGPYWPMLVFVTYAIIFSVSIWTIKAGIWGKGKPPVLIFAWFCLTMGLIVALALTACRDPGILYRMRDEPMDDTWRWSDPADSYRPRNAWFDSDTAVIVEGFDHT